MNKVLQSPCPCTHDADIPVRESDKQVSKYRVFEMGMGWEGGRGCGSKTQGKRAEPLKDKGHEAWKVK